MKVCSFNELSEEMQKTVVSKWQNNLDVFYWVLFNDYKFTEDGNLY